MNKRTNNIARNLPKVTNTGNNTLNMWLLAAEEIIKELRQRMGQLEGNKSSDSGNGTGQTVIKLPNLNDYERKDNKVSVINENTDGNMNYPSVAALKEYVGRMSSEADYQNVFEEWEIELQSFEELDVQQGDYLKIVGNGAFGSLELRNGDIAFVYNEEGIGLQLIVIIDSRILKKGVHTTNDLDEGNQHFYFNELRVLNTVLENLIENTAEIEGTDSVLVALGKAKGRINHLQALISFLEHDLQQKINAINADLETAEQTIADQQLELETKLDKDELLQQLLTTVPAQTGTYILKCTDGVLSWVEQP